MNTKFASESMELDELLDLICVEIQLNPTRREQAESAYANVGNWLDAPNSELRVYRPTVFPQGSMALDTTVRPLAHTEFDLDGVCLFEITGRTPNPMAVYDMVYERLAQNGKLVEKIEKKYRCIRLNYSGDFHLDVIPAVPDPTRRPGETRLWIPDIELKEWWPSDPKGFVAWFEKQIRFWEKRAFSERVTANVEPLRQPQSPDTKSPLKLAVQLLKRWRDVKFEGREGIAPSSIVLTTLAGKLFRGEAHPTDAIMNILDGIARWAQREPIRFQNPSNETEWFTNKWDADPEMYEIFLEEVAEFRVRWERLLTKRGLPEKIAELKRLFQEAPVTNAVGKFAEARRTAAGVSLQTSKSNGAIRIGTAGAAPVGFVANKPHGFHGGK
jgi:hypothetical protein